MSFAPSQYSSLTSDDYGDASTDWVDVRDYPGDMFRVYSDGTVELLRTGTTWSPAVGSSETYNKVIAALADYPGNEEKMASVLGSDAVTSAISAAGPLLFPSGGSSTPSGEEMPQAQPLIQRWWFWPAVILGSTAVVGGAALYITRTESGQRQWAKLTRKNPKVIEVF